MLSSPSVHALTIGCVLQSTQSCTRRPFQASRKPRRTRLRGKDGRRGEGAEGGGGEKGWSPQAFTIILFGIWRSLAAVQLYDSYLLPDGGRSSCIPLLRLFSTSPLRVLAASVRCFWLICQPLRWLSFCFRRLGAKSQYRPTRCGLSYVSIRASSELVSHSHGS